MTSIFNGETSARVDRWLDWMHRYIGASGQMVSEDSLAVTTEEERELLAIRLALFARGLTLFQGVHLLATHDRRLDVRIHARAIIEVVIYLIALDKDPTFVVRLKDDDYRGRMTRAKLHLDAMAPSAELHQELAAFVALGYQRAKFINVGELLDGTSFERLYRVYRDISGDAAHVTISSLNRHYVEDPNDQSALLIVHPEVPEFEQTLRDVCVSMLIATWLTMKIKKKTATWAEFEVLARQYKQLAVQFRS